MTKSERIAVGLCDERVSAIKVEKQPWRPSAVRSTPSSRNSPAAGIFEPLLFVYDQGTGIDPEFTIAKVLPPIGLPLLMATSLPVASSPCHWKTLMLEVEPPTVKSLTRRMSPFSCAPLNGWPPFWVTFGFSLTLFAKNQK